MACTKQEGWNGGGPYPCSRSSFFCRDMVTEKKPRSCLIIPGETEEGEAWKAGRDGECFPADMAATPVAGLRDKVCPWAVIRGDLRRSREGRRACPAEQAFWPVMPSDIVDNGRRVCRGEP